MPLRLPLFLAAAVIAFAAPQSRRPAHTMVNSPPRSTLRVGGHYTTAVSIVTDSCGGTRVEPRDTEVSHAVGDTSLVLTHAGNRFSGVIATNGTFRTNPTTLEGGGSTWRIALTGAFNRTGFTARVTVSQTQQPAGATCRYVVQWVGTRTDGTNDIPSASSGMP